MWLKGTDIWGNTTWGCYDSYPIISAIREAVESDKGDNTTINFGGRLGGLSYGYLRDPNNFATRDKLGELVIGHNIKRKR